MYCLNFFKGGRCRVPAFLSFAATNKFWCWTCPCLAGRRKTHYNPDICRGV